ncbi:hypothetical protein BC332_04733 [Capsicum chinense]|nr:hypothetical protein BC332_04733 [Capsicum chinense]
MISGETAFNLPKEPLHVIAKKAIAYHCQEGHCISLLRGSFHTIAQEGYSISIDALDTTLASRISSTFNISVDTLDTTLASRIISVFNIFVDMFGRVLFHVKRNYFDFAISSECSACKCQDYKVKCDGVINAINVLSASVKEMTFKRGVIPSKWILYPYTLLEIKAAKRRRKDTFKPEVFRNEECLINIIKGFSIPVGLPWHLVDEVYISINCGDEFHWVLEVVVLKERHIRVYDSMSRRRSFGPSSEIQKLAKILPTYLDMSGFLDQKVRTD